MNTLDKRPTIYMVGDDGGAIKTNNPQAVKVMESQGYHVATQVEYAKVVRRLQAEDRREVERELRG